MKVWDYDLPKNWRPKTKIEWQWYLIRKLNYGDFYGLRKEIVKKYFPIIKKFLDKGKRLLLENYFNND